MPDHIRQRLAQLRAELVALAQQREKERMAREFEYYRGLRG